jgi:pyruvate,orthophosphate dikinase
VDDPDEQLLECIELVIGSWNSAMARVYRDEVGIADGWGTAVIVQNMVYGNLDLRSGTGVLLTHHPQRGSDSFELYGDFVIQGQGDDVVSGLVDTFPISQRQRFEEPQDAGGSLERDFPETYDALERFGRALVEEHGWTHQEIEFTFESGRPEDLFILQAREAVADEPGELPAFRSTEALAGSRLSVGIGVSGGAVSCRVAQNATDIARLRHEFPQDPVLLVRPDTVPDDIHLLLQADALLTGIGGATSHAAVVAKRLGKTCVVGCRELRVYEAEGRSEIAGHPLEAGDWVSMSGLDGSVYLGAHRIESGGMADRTDIGIGATG